jgi:hypothetical protein
MLFMSGTRSLLSFLFPLGSGLQKNPPPSREMVTEDEEIFAKRGGSWVVFSTGKTSIATLMQKQSAVMASYDKVYK